MTNEAAFAGHPLSSDWRASQPGWTNDPSGLPMALGPFTIRIDEEDGWLLEGGKSGRRVIGTDSLFTAFRAMLDAYEIWFPTKQDWVYFIGAQAAIGEKVKIGYSTNPEARLGQIQTGHPDRLSILAMTPGGRPVEAGYHRRWSASRRTGEWFMITASILAEIARLTPVPEDEMI